MTGTDHGTQVDSASMHSSDPHELAFLLVLPLFLLCVFGGVWVYLRKAPKHQVFKRICLSLLVIFLMALTPIQSLTGYTISLSFGPAMILALSLGACLLETKLIWHKCPAFRVPEMLALVAAVILLFLSGTLYEVIETSSIFQLKAGRVSPTISYRIVTTESMVGATEFYQYEIYKNPRWFPFVQTRTGWGPLPCGSDLDDLGSHRTLAIVSHGPDANTLSVTCIYQGGSSLPLSQQVNIQN